MKILCGLKSASAVLKVSLTNVGVNLNNSFLQMKINKNKNNSEVISSKRSYSFKHLVKRICGLY